MQYHPQTRRKYLLLYHVIFVVKYRRKTLSPTITDTLKGSLLKIVSNSEFCIPEMDVDQDHLHLMIDSSPALSISQIVRRIKQQTTPGLWSLHGSYSDRQFWLEKTFWSDGYFASSIGNASIETVRNYIQKQGQAYIPPTLRDQWVLRPIL